MLHQEPPRLDLVCGRFHQRHTLVEPPGQEVGAPQEPGGLRTEQCDVRIAGDAAGALEHGAGSFEVSSDEGDVSQTDAGGGQAIWAVDSFSDGDRLPAGGHALLELPELGEAAREPCEVDRLVRLPGPDHRAANALWRLHDGSQ